MITQESLELTNTLYGMLKKIDIYEANNKKLQDFLDNQKSQITILTDEQIKAIPNLQEGLNKLNAIIQEYNEQIKNICKENKCEHLLEVAKIMKQFPL